MTGQTLLVTANSCWNLVHFRAPILKALVERGHRVIAAAPLDDASGSLESLGLEIEPLAIDARGLSPVADASLLLDYRKLMKRIRPAAMLAFTAKPNVYGSMAASLHNIPTINTITGLGTGFLTGRTLQSVMISLYRLALKRSHRIFFHNDDDRDLFLRLQLVQERQAAVVAGSGLDLQRFKPPPARPADGPLTFLFIGRLLRDKGAREFARAAHIVKSGHNAHFQVLGPVDPHPKAVPPDEVDRWHREGLVELLGTADDVRPAIAGADCVVLPSYREGLPRVLLEASAMARPVIATDVPGCRQAVDDGITGLLCEVRSAQSLADAVVAMIAMPHEQRMEMGKRGREKAEREFAQERVVDAYIAALGEAGIH